MLTVALRFFTGTALQLIMGITVLCSNWITVVSTTNEPSSHSAWRMTGYRWRSAT